jgi:Cu/Ag efflux protein CusF
VVTHSNLDLATFRETRDQSRHQSEVSEGGDMTTKTAAVLTIALCLMSAAALTGQEPITKAQSVSATATIQAIDSTARTITLRSESGGEDTYKVGPAVERFNELKVGDTVKMTYTESLVFQIRKAGEKPGAATMDASVNRGEGALPSGTIGVQEKMTVTIKAIDPDVPSITVTTPDNRTVTRKVDDKKNLEGVQVGDLIDITYTRALVTSIERQQ